MSDEKRKDIQTRLWKESNEDLLDTHSSPDEPKPEDLLSAEDLIAQGLVCVHGLDGEKELEVYDTSEVGESSTSEERRTPPEQQAQGWTPPMDLIEYLVTLISPPDEKADVIDDLDKLDWNRIKEVPDTSSCGIIARGTPTEEQSKELHRILKPGAHLLLIAPDNEPWGSTGACRVEDAGFEIRDAIAVALPLGELDKLPSRSEPPRHPFHYVPKADRGEREFGLTELRNEESGRILNVHPCLHPDALVMTDNGYRPISEVAKGTQVLAADGQFHPVEDVSTHPYTSSHLSDISVRGVCHSSLVSDNHPHLIWRPQRRGAALKGGAVTWVEASQVRKGDYTMTPVLQTGSTKPEHGLDWFFAFGLYLAEGSIFRAGHGAKVFTSFTLHKNETDLIERVGRLGKVSVYPKKGTKAVQVVLWGAAVGADFHALGGTGDAFKSIAPELWALPKKYLLEIFRGWVAGDGGTVRTYFQAKTVSPDLASQMFLLGELAGYKSNLYFVPPPEPGTTGIGERRFKSVLPSYTLQFHPEKKDGRKQPPRTLEHGGTIYTLRYVKSVNTIPYTGDVWNLTVEGSPTFQTAVGMSHNTVKPVELMVRLLHDVPKTPPDADLPPITNDTKASDVIDTNQVLDPFLGSGPTGIACLETGHNFRGIEREEEYLKIATSRTKSWVNRSKHRTLVGDATAPIIISDVDKDKDTEPKEHPELNLFFGD